jgi:hypothetical protein
MEYKIIYKYSAREFETMLNKWYAEGYEVVTVQFPTNRDVDTNYYALLKKN